MGPTPPSFWASGPSWRLGRAIRLLRGDRLDVARLALAAALVGWAPTLLLTLIAWLRSDVVDPILTLPATHVRWLAGVPLLLLWVRLLDLTARRALGSLREAELVTRPHWARLDEVEARARRLLDATSPRVVMLAIVVAAAAWRASDASTPAQAWAEGVGQGVFQLVGLDALWRWCAWARLLHGLTGVGLVAEPLHPDRVGGLGLLLDPSRAFGLGAAGPASVVAAVLAGQILDGETTAPRFATTVAIVAATVLVLALAPLLMLVPTWLRARRHARTSLAAFAHRYAAAFEDRWIRATAPGDPLGSPDIQSLADVQSAVETALSTRAFPIDGRLVATVLVPAVLPFAPLVLLIVPTAEVLDVLRRALL